ncbi:zinc-binding dehydrogenase [Nocardia gipuzkoensis]
MGCKVIGIVGGAKKCSWITDRAGLDAAIDYKRDHIDLRLTELAPDGVDVFLDALGGRILEHGLAHLARRGRVVLAGAISPGYHGSDPACGPRNYMRLALHLALLDEYQLLAASRGTPRIWNPICQSEVCRIACATKYSGSPTRSGAPPAGRAEVVCSASGPRVSAWVQ